MQARVTAIEKWTAVADICRCLHNFNGVLQVCAAFTNAAVFRLKKTWDKVPKTVIFTRMTTDFKFINLVSPRILRRSNTQSTNCKRLFAQTGDFVPCVRLYIVVIHHASPTWACI